MFRRKKKTVIKFSGKKHSGLGIASTAIGAAILVISFILVILATRSAGGLSVWIGLLGILLFAGSVTGLYFGVRSFRQKDIYYGFPIAGCVINGLLVIAFIFMYFLGLSL